MSFAHSPRQYLGVRAHLPPDLVTAKRAPISTDTAYVKGTLWIDIVGLASYQWSGVTWIALGTGAVGGVVTLTASSGGPISPSAGNINLSGTANQITTAGSGSTITFSLPAAITAPGSLTTTTTLASGTTLTSGSSLAVTTSAVIGTTLTITAGDETITNGNLIMNGAAKQIRIHGGAATDFIGTAVLASGTVTVANTNIAATDRILVTRSAVNASTALGVFKVVKTASTNFIITACKPADATTETGDASTVEYVIIRQV